MNKMKIGKSFAAAAMAVSMMMGTIPAHAATKQYVIAKADSRFVYVYANTVGSTKFNKYADNTLFGYGKLKKIALASSAVYKSGEGTYKIKKNTKKFIKFVKSVQTSPGTYKYKGKKIKMHMGLPANVKTSRGKVTRITSLF